MVLCDVIYGPQVRLRKLEECKGGWQEDKEARTENMKFAIMTFEVVRDILTLHAELITCVSPLQLSTPN